MKERDTNSALPKYIEKVVEFEMPENDMIVRLPRSSGTTSCMHTDMMGSLVRSLRTIKPEIRKRFLIQGRVMDSATWQKFKNDRVYRYFYEMRCFKEKADNKREVIKVLVPKKLKLTDSQVRDYYKLVFTPESLSEKYGFCVGWYPAKFIADRAEGEESFNSLAPFLGAVNQFKIGSNELKPAMLKMVGLKIMMGFEDDERCVVSHSVTARLSQKTIDSVSRVVEMSL
jgi:hypothetical protein